MRKQSAVSVKVLMRFSTHQFLAVVTVQLLVASVIPVGVVAAPALPSLVSPASNAVNVSLSPDLTIGVSDSVSNNFMVTFYGRPAVPGADFTIVALPDTQYYVSSKYGGLPGMFNAQTDWIRSNAIPRNIAFVAQLGDCVESGDTNTGVSNLGQWQNATNALYRLEPPLGLVYPDGVGYGVAVGNHDQSPNGNPDGTTTFYNQYFGIAHFTGRSYYGGNYGANNDNHFALFSAGGMDFIVIFFEYDTTADAAVLNWANTLLQTHASRRAIVVSHYIGRATTPSTFGAQGAAIYTALKNNANLFLMLSGHVDGEGSRQDVFNANTVHTLVSDYQFRGNGGDGYLRLMEFSPSNSVIRVKTYSPWLNAYETDADSEFTIPYPMQSGVTNFTAIQTNSNVNSGTQTSCNWSGLQPNTLYEWYATVSDGTNTVSGPVWRFTTAVSNTPPTLSTFVHHTMRVNTSTNISFAVLDAETPNDLTITVTTSNGKLLPPTAMLVSGVGTNRTLQVTPAPDEAGAAWVTVNVSDGILEASQSFMLKVLRSQIVTFWDFNSNPPDNNTSTGTLLPASGSGVATSVGTATNSLNSNVAPVSFDPTTNTLDNSKWRMGSFPPQGTANKSSGAQFRVSTTGYQDIALSWDHYNSATGSRYWRLQYTLDGTNYTDSSFVYTNPVAVTWFPTGLSLADVPGVDDNPDFGFRIVSEWESTATGQGPAQYRGTQVSGAYGTSGTLWLDMVTVSGDALVSYLPTSLKITLAADQLQISWPTNAPGYTLQQTTNLQPANWLDVAGLPLIIGDEFVVTNAPSATSRFYRLRW